MISDRGAAKQAFLDQAGWRGAAIAPLAGDASNRRYDRVANGPGGAGAVLMDAPPDAGEAILAFLAFSAHLRAEGFNAPEIFAADETQGFALIEDFGDDLFARVSARDDGSEPQLYAAAVDVLAALRRKPPPASVAWRGQSMPVSPYDAATLRREAALAAEWWAAPLTDLGAAAAEFESLIDDACRIVADERSVLVLRDYHAENLIWLPERAGLGRVGLLDFQDALAGSPAYDLVSLLEDARRDTSAELREAMIARYLTTSPDLDEEAFRAAYAVLGAQRNLKIVGIFARLCRRDGKPGYIDMIPRVWRHLERDVAHPELAKLADFVAKWLPAPTPVALDRIRGLAA